MRVVSAVLRLLDVVVPDHVGDRLKQQEGAHRECQPPATPSRQGRGTLADGHVNRWDQEDEQPTVERVLVQGRGHEREGDRGHEQVKASGPSPTQCHPAHEEQPECQECRG